MKSVLIDWLTDPILLLIIFVLEQFHLFPVDRSGVFFFFWIWWRLEWSRRGPGGWPESRWNFRRATAESCRRRRWSRRGFDGDYRRRRGYRRVLKKSRRNFEALIFVDRCHTQPFVNLFFCSVDCTEFSFFSLSTFYLNFLGAVWCPREVEFKAKEKGKYEALFKFYKWDHH